ncbi:MAG TPA: TerC family protein, partial [Geobacteraceae bacterium]|nr:TerC family protein [Geobacteraceae bacterium]
FISILAGKLPPHQQEKARIAGLGLAMFTRIALLFSLTWLMGLTAPLFTVLGRDISGRDIILIAGGMFLLGKSTMEIHEKLEGEEGMSSARVGASFAGVLVQIMLLDIVFSLDSIITALGMANRLAVMVAAVVLAVGFMMFFSGAISAFVDRHPTIKMLALSFLILIGVALIGDGFDMHIPKGYIYFAMAFSVMVEMLNLRLRGRGAPVKLHQPYVEEPGKSATE